MFLKRLFKNAVIAFWVLDILNFPFMEMFDTTYPFNTLFWCLVFAICGGVQVSIKSE